MPPADELADDLPHRAPAARVQARRRLVEEDQPRAADERHRQVEPALHAAAVGRGRLVGGLDEVELLEQLLARALPGRAAEVLQVGHQPQVLAPGEQPVDGRELAGDADRARAPRPARCRRRGRRRAASPRVGGEQRREDLDRGRLARAVGPEQREHGARLDVEVDPVEDDLVAVGLAEPADGDHGAILAPCWHHVKPLWCQRRARRSNRRRSRRGRARRALPRRARDRRSQEL